MLTLLSLPEDALRLVLTLSTPATIRRCQQVCRFLRRIAEADAYIQYLLELDICGYAEPDNPRSDLSYSEKREIIRTHRARLDHPEKIEPEIYELQASDHRSTSVYIGGVYACAVRTPTTSAGVIRQLYFFQLPSPNRGVNQKHWVIADLGVDAAAYTIDPEQDLLVLLDGDPYTGYNLHLRSMFTNRAHPKASPASPVLSYRCSRTSDSYHCVSFEVSGDLLAAAFRPGPENLPSCIVIWSWNTGAELTRIETFTLYLSLAFLSEDSFVMLRYIETQINASKGEFGFLDVYRFNPQAADSTPPIHTASFTLPPLPLADLYRISVSIAHLACAPTNSSGIFPKVFVPAPQRRLLRLDAPTMDSLVWFDRSSYRSLLIPSVVLLNAAYIGQEHDTDPLVVPWADWATQTSWVDIAELGNTQGTPWFTQRMAGIHLGTPVTKPELVIFDFDQHRVKNSSMSDSQSIWQVCTPGNNPTGVINTVDEDAVFQNSEDLARKKFVKAVLPVEMEMDEYDSVMTDEEHVIIRMIRFPVKPLLLVYTF